MVTTEEFRLRLKYFEMTYRMEDRPREFLVRQTKKLYMDILEEYQLDPARVFIHEGRLRAWDNHAPAVALKNCKALLDSIDNPKPNATARPVDLESLAEKMGWKSGEDELRRHLEILTTPVNRGGVIVREIEYTSLEDVLAGTGRPYFGNITDQARAVVALFEYWNQAGHIPGLYSAGKKPRRNNTLMQCFDKTAGKPFAHGSIRNLDPDPDRVKIYRDMLEQ
jgi:hypothetical protein